MSGRRILIDTLRAIARQPSGAFGLGIVVLVVATAVLADVLAPYPPMAIDVYHRLEPPNLLHWLGTDQLGRDVLSRVILGTRIAIGIASGAILLSLACACLLGLIAGYGPRWLDGVLVLFFDGISSLPMVMLALAMAVAIGPGVSTVVLVIVLYSVPTYARLVRAQVLALKQRDFVLAARAMNAGLWRILLRHLLPNVIGPVLIIACMDFASVIGLEAGLSFLGLGVSLGVPSWGTILHDGFAIVRVTPVLLAAGGLPLVIATLGFTFFGEALRDALDPKLNGGR